MLTSILQAWLVVSSPLKVYTVSTVLFHKYGGENVAITNCMSHFSMFVPTKATVKLDNGNMGHAQGIGVILCRFPKWSIIYLVVPVYYFQVILPKQSHQVPSNFMLVFKRLHLNLLKIVVLLTLKVIIRDYPTKLKKSLISSNRNFQNQPSQRQ